MGRGTDIPQPVVEDEVFEMDEFAIDPQRGAGVGKILALEKAGADGRTGDALVETSQYETGVVFTLSFQNTKCHKPDGLRRRM